MLSTRFIAHLVMLIMTTLPITLTAQDISGSDVLISRDGINISVADIEQYLLTIPEDQRQQFLASKKRVLEMVGNLLDSKTLYQKAVEQGIPEREDVAAQIHWTTMQLVIKALVTSYVDENMLDDYSTLAREHYLTNRELYQRPETVTVKHVLVGNRTRSSEDALAEAERIRALITSGEISFDDAIWEYSDDPSKKKNAGVLEDIVRGQTHPAFEQAAFSLNADEPLSDVVKTSFGNHIIMYIGRDEGGQQSYEAVEDEVIQYVKQQHRERLSKDYVNQIKAQAVDVNEEVVNRYLEELGSW